MLTISSIAVGPPPQSTPSVRAQPVTPARQSNAVARENAAGSQIAPQGEAARVQATAAPPVLAPVVPTQEAQRADPQTNAFAPERVGIPLTGVAAAAAAAVAAGRTNAAEEADAEANRAAEEERRAQTAEAQRQAQATQGRRPPARGAGRNATADAEPAFPDVKNPALEAMDTQIKELLPNMWKASRAAVDMVIGEDAMKSAEERAQRLQELQTRLNARPLANLPADEAAQSYSAAADGNRSAPGGQVDQLA